MTTSYALITEQARGPSGGPDYLEIYLRLKSRSETLDAQVQELSAIAAQELTNIQERTNQLNDKLDEARSSYSELVARAQELEDEETQRQKLAETEKENVEEEITKFREEYHQLEALCKSEKAANKILRERTELAKEKMSMASDLVKQLAETVEEKNKKPRGLRNALLKTRKGAKDLLKKLQSIKSKVFEALKNSGLRCLAEER